MNNYQKRLLIIIAVVFIVMLAFPPFTANINGITINGGYSFILTGVTDQNSFNVNVSLLFIQWLFIVSIGFTGWKVLTKND